MSLYYINGGEIQENVREVELIVLRNYRDQGKEKERMTSSVPCGQLGRWLYILWDLEHEGWA